MIEVTDEMVQLAVDKFLHAPGVTIGAIDAAMRDALAAVLAIVERDRRCSDPYQVAHKNRSRPEHCATCWRELGRPDDSAGAVPP